MTKQAYFVRFTKRTASNTAATRRSITLQTRKKATTDASADAFAYCNLSRAKRV